MGDFAKPVESMWSYSTLSVSFTLFKFLVLDFDHLFSLYAITDMSHRKHTVLHR